MVGCFSLLETAGSELAHPFSSLLRNCKAFTHRVPPSDLHVEFLTSWEGTVPRCDVPGATGLGSKLGPAGIALLYFLLKTGL